MAAKRFLQAPSLEAHLRKRNLCDALCIAADVAEAMAYLHSMDIVHGRLTPGAPHIPGTACIQGSGMGLLLKLVLNLLCQSHKCSCEGGLGLSRVSPAGKQ